MTLQQLRYVTAIAEAGTLSEAARRFYIAQPSLTASLRELEEELGLTADMLAEQMGVNPSTVSRAIKGKYVKTPTKVYPLSYFLTRAGNRSGDAAPDSRSEILAALHKLLQEEDPVHPLSDAQLADQLTAQGITTTRRTVAKYREELGIPGTAGRRE